MRRDARRASRAFVEVLGAIAPPRRAVGIEHELSLWHGDRQVDFRRLVHAIGVDGRTLDPGDPNAYRCRWGGVITADGREAEIATPPVDTAPGFAGALSSRAESGRAALEACLHADVRAAGYSTHISVTVPDADADRIARTFARTFAPALMLLLDGRDSPGLLIRPRPGRLELCGDFVRGDDLEAAALVAVATTALVEASVRDRRTGPELPPLLDLDLARAAGRYGYYVDRSAFGPDLYTEGRTARLRRTRGGSVRATEVLDAALAATREHAGARPTDLQVVTDLVRGARALPTERGVVDDVTTVVPVSAPDEWSAVVEVHRRSAISVRAVVATWHTTVFEVRGAHRPVFANVPTPALAPFLDRLDEGLLDDVFDEYAASSSMQRVLASAPQTAAPGLYDRVGPGRGLLLPERNERGRRPRRGGGGHGGAGRPGKRDRAHTPRPRPRWLVPAAVAGALVLLAGAAAVASSGDDPAPGAGSPGAGPSGRQSSGAVDRSGGTIQVVATYKADTGEYATFNCRAKEGCRLSEVGAPDGGAPMTGGRFHLVHTTDGGPICIVGGVPEGNEVFIETWDLVPSGTTKIDGIDVPATMTGTLREEVPAVGTCLRGSLRVSTFSGGPTAA